LNSVVEDWGVSDVALNPVAEYRRVPSAGLPTSDSGTLSVITPVLLS